MATARSKYLVKNEPESSNTAMISENHTVMTALFVSSATGARIRGNTQLTPNTIIKAATEPKFHPPVKQSLPDSAPVIKGVESVPATIEQPSNVPQINIQPNQVGQKLPGPSQPVQPEAAAPIGKHPVQNIGQPGIAQVGQHPVQNAGIVPAMMQIPASQSVTS